MSLRYKPARPSARRHRKGDNRLSYKQQFHRDQNRAGPIRSVPSRLNARFSESDSLPQCQLHLHPTQRRARSRRGKADRLLHPHCRDRCRRRSTKAISFATAGNGSRLRFQTVCDTEQFPQLLPGLLMTLVPFPGRVILLMFVSAKLYPPPCITRKPGSNASQQCVSFNGTVWVSESSWNTRITKTNLPSRLTSRAQRGRCCSSITKARFSSSKKLM